MSGIGSHTRPVEGATDDWLTPPDWIERLGPFDLDPCASSFMAWRPWETAARCFTNGGLDQPWDDGFVYPFVWCNPPYGKMTGAWLARLSKHPGGGVACVFARTETLTFQSVVWPRASALLFVYGRPHFHFPNGERAPGNSGGPIVLIAYGARAKQQLAFCGIKGAFVVLR